VFGRSKDNRLAERLVRRFFYKYYARNLLYELQIRARGSSVDYIQANMADAMMFSNRNAMFAHCMKSAPDEGLVLEFGVAQGASTRQLASMTGRQVHGFDSFQGLPEDWSGTEELQGKFSTGGALPDVPASVTLHPGWFEDSIPEFKDQFTDPVAVLHVDCDLYSSARIVLFGMADRLKAGTVVIFDEYFNYPNWQQHEFRAFQEFVDAFDVEYRYLGFSIKNGHVAVVLTKIKSEPVQP
jgi:hypothetical protein